MNDFLDRSIEPASEAVGEVGFLPVVNTSLPNGIGVSIIRAGSREVTKIDWVFPAGSVQAGRPLLASTVGHLLTEGTSSRKASEVADIIDFHGGHLSSQAFFHCTVVTLVSLTRELPGLIELASDIIQNAAFEKHEIETYIDKRREEFIVDSLKVKSMAARRLCEVVFGENHPYGWQLKLNHFDTITREQVVKFHGETYSPQNCQIIVSGQPGDDIEDLLARYFGSVNWQKRPAGNNYSGDITPLKGTFHLVEKEGALQSAIRFGRAIFNNRHPDFVPLKVLNTILGGYFGSRLMTTVREKEGLTYGINSNIVSYKDHGIWYVATEVKSQRRQEAVDAIAREMKRLASEPVPREELETVRNYMLGELLRFFDGPFLTSDIYRALLELNLDFEYYNGMAMEIKTITPERIMELASTYLAPDNFNVVVAGK